MKGVPLVRSGDLGGGVRVGRGGGGDGGGTARGLPMHRAKVGLTIFLAVVTSLFMLIASAYGVRMRYADWQPMPEPALLWANTLVLLLSSVALQWAVGAVRRGDAGALRIGLIGAGALAAAFLAGQLWAWQQLSAMGYFAAGNPANAFFYMVTALHGAHLFGGLVAWARTFVRMRRGAPLARLRLSVELCAIYWHFLLAVWLVLFGLLLLT